MSRTIIAYTPARPAPEFINFSYVDDGVRVLVRSASPDGSTLGPTASIDIPRYKWTEMLEAFKPRREVSAMAEAVGNGLFR